jgi:hypothetical protein
MISSEVERTLVKSPPELWAELSDPAALARHLGELGEIRIVRIEPESTVEWAAENTTGTVSIKPSGWGTKVTLSVTRELDTDGEEAQHERPNPAPTAEPEPATAKPNDLAGAVGPQPASAAAAEPEPATTAAAEPQPAAATTATTAEPQPAPSPPQRRPAQERDEPESRPTAEPAIEREPRRGFFARLFARRRVDGAARQPIDDSTAPPQPPAQIVPAREPADPPYEPAHRAIGSERTQERPDAFAAVRAALAPEGYAAARLFESQPAAERAPAGAPDATAQQSGAGVEQIGCMSAELMAAEEVAAEEVTAVLTAVLDRLGAAHHRPFSRA